MPNRKFTTHRLHDSGRKLRVHQVREFLKNLPPEADRCVLIVEEFEGRLTQLDVQIPEEG